MLIICCGLPGSGKSYLAKKLSKSLGAKRISTDAMRRKIRGAPDYSEAGKRIVYERMFDEAAKQLKEKDIILDATFSKAEMRETAGKLAEKNSVPFFIVEKIADEKTVAERMKRRNAVKKKRDSDADFEVYRKIKGEFEEIKESHAAITDSDSKEFEEFLGKIHLEEIRHGLGRREAYRETGEVKIIETHISLVFLTSKHAYKVKKPVNLGFLDYSSLAKRKRFCEEEVKINNMLSKGIYLGVVAVKKNNGGAMIGGKGKTIDYAVKMKRLPEEEIMAHLLEKNLVEEKTVREIASITARFHAKSRRTPQYGSPKAVWKAFSSAFLVKDKIGKAGEIEVKAKKFLDENRKLFLKRAKEGKVRECHGDLHSGNVFIHEGKPIVFDAIEFNKAISCCDTIADAAFMAMDLEFHGKKELADAFIEEYLKITKDYEAKKLLPFYKCYRAAIRMMANAMNGTKKGLETAERYAGKALEYAGNF